MASDLLAAADPHSGVTEDVLYKVDLRLGATRATGQAHVQADRHHARAFGSLLVEEVEAVAQKREEVFAGTEDAAAAGGNYGIPRLSRGVVLFFSCIFRRTSGSHSSAWRPLD